MFESLFLNIDFQKEVSHYRKFIFQIKLSTQNVIKRGFVTERTKTKDIVKEHRSYCDVEKELKNFKGITLAYVTPVSKKK